jgi:hypothetical protein
MGSRDRPGKQVKKKPQAKETKPRLQPLLEPPTNVELIKPRRKPRTVDTDDEG